MRIGYACLTIGVKESNFKSCILKNADDENLLALIEHNLDSLDNIIDYNIEKDIKLFRISSGIIPFGSSPANKLKWWDIFGDKLSSIGSKINESGMRVSMHPGQYTVLNSNREDVVERAIEDLTYHNRFLDSLSVDGSHKIILHVGGVYGNKEKAMEKFIGNYRRLNGKIKNRLVIENDDKSYTIEDVLNISKVISIPVIYDSLHNTVNPSDPWKDHKFWIEKARKTWKEDDGAQKIHYSQQDKSKRPGAHSETIELSVFLDFIEDLDSKLHIMLEVKDKNLSAVKCINGTENRSIGALELEWSKYKYSILEASPSIHNQIRNLLKDKEKYPVEKFYSLIEEALEAEESIGAIINGAEHVWGYFKNKASSSEKKRFEKLLKDYKVGKTRIKSIKNHLEKLSEKYNEEYLLDSYYFDL